VSERERERETMIKKALATGTIEAVRDVIICTH